jgi:hypothetical protein
VRLQPVVANIAKDLGKEAVVIHDLTVDGGSGTNSSEWVLVASDSAILSDRQIKDAAVAVESGAGLRTWTDDYSNLFQALR